MECRKSERVPIMFDKGLLRKVDDFSFANRIRSRGQAVRELIEIGLESEKMKNEKDGDVTA